MITSLRRIATTLTLCGMLGLLVSSAVFTATLCSQGTANCLAAAVGLSDVGMMDVADFAVSQSTTASVPAQSSTLTLLLQIVQQSALYILIFGVAVIIVLELFELKYLRALQSRKSA
jgi:hypothetical protein